MNINATIFLILFILIDGYVFFGLKNSLQTNSFQFFILVFYGIAAVLCYIATYALTVNFIERPITASPFYNFLIGFGFSFFVFKLLLLLFLVFDDALRIANYIYNSIIHLFTSTKEVTFEDRRKFIVNFGLVVASVPFASMLYGITKGKYNYKLKKVGMKFSNLPKEFDGLKIVQISDIHAGSFDSISDVQRGVDLINAQEPDIVFFTGDLVNNDAREIAPFIDVFKTISSKYGTFSILGNHDYGDYKKWPSAIAKKENLAQLEAYQRQMNFTLLKNENILIEKDGASIRVLGVENWGKPPFVTHGDLDKSLEGVAATEFKILLSHDPSHWDAKVVPHKTHIDLTLSGHTHGMQFGIDIPGFKWSPVKYKYPRWSGLYSEYKQHLYVNRGFGFLGFPGRVGMWPEITLITMNT
jgi:uncharacterized protein